MSIEINRQLHGLGEQAGISQWPLVHAAGWWVASELVRRHPGELKVYLTGGEFQYDVLAVSRMGGQIVRGKSTAIVWMNRNPGCHFTTGTWFDDSSSTERFNWLEVILAPDRIEYVIRQLEREAGLSSPAKSPPTTSQSIVARVISGFLTRSVFTRSKWLALNGMWDNGMGEASSNRNLFNAIPGMRDLVPVPDDGFFDNDTYRYWFLSRAVPTSTSPWPQSDGGPLIGFDSNSGQCWDLAGRHVDLMKRYNELGRSVDALISDVCPPAF